MLSKVLLPLLKLALSPVLKMVVSSVSCCAHAPVTAVMSSTSNVRICFFIFICFKLFVVSFV